MSKTWIVIDVNNIAWRAQYTTGHMAFDGHPTGVIFGLLRELIALHDRFVSCDFVFCFDSNKSLRQELCPTYKSSRSLLNYSDSEQARIHRKNRQEVDEQVERLRCEILPALGMKNLLAQEGYEADDIMAAVVKCSNENKYILVSSDQDLFQCLWPGVTWFSPQSRGVMTRETLTKMHGIDPEQWAWVKALAGCKADDVKGAMGIGEFRACQYLTGGIKAGSPTANKIEAFLQTEEFKMNLQLTTLPFDDTLDIWINNQAMIEEEAWDDVCRSVGIKNLAYMNFVK